MQSVASVGFEMLNNSGLCVGRRLEETQIVAEPYRKGLRVRLVEILEVRVLGLRSSMAAFAVTVTLPTVKVAVSVTNTNWFVFSAPYKFVKEEVDGKVIV